MTHYITLVDADENQTFEQYDALVQEIKRRVPNAKLNVRTDQPTIEITGVDYFTLNAMLEGLDFYVIFE